MSKRPQTVPDRATQLDDGRWLELNEMGHAVRRQWWDKEGECERIEFRTPEGELKSFWKFFKSGSASLDVESMIGEVTRYDVKVTQIADILPAFPAHKKVEIVRFQIRNFNPADESFNVGKVAYFDSRDRTIDELGERVERPGWVDGEVDPGDASDGDETDTDQRHGTWVSSHENGALHLKAEYKDGDLVSVEEWDEDAHPVFSRSYYPEVLVLHCGESTLTYTRSADSRSIRIQNEYAEVHKEVQLAEIEDANDFVRRHKDFYGICKEFRFLDMARTFEISASGFKIDSVVVEEFEEFFKASIIAENGAGDALILIEEEGEFEGFVFANYHDEGLYHLEDLDEYIESNIDDDTAADPNALIEELPFTQFEVASNLSDLFALIDIVPIGLDLETLADKPNAHG